MSERMEAPYWALRIAFGVVPIVAGLDKFVGLLTDWEAYLSPLVTAWVPASLFMKIVGVIEIAAGAIVLAGMTRFGGYLIAAWLVAITLNLLTTGRYFDIAARDAVLAVAAFTLARLSEVRQPVGGGEAVRPPRNRAA
ncbi:MAG TPA: hypothetical protein VMS56_02240 [Thermoanaerobaculia bacterium]|nr:hypothetical protein [Thermoanaerobaculia bacterium]